MGIVQFAEGHQAANGVIVKKPLFVNADRIVSISDGELPYMAGGTPIGWCVLRTDGGAEIPLIGSAEECAQLWREALAGTAAPVKPDERTLPELLQALRARGFDV